MSHVWLLNLHTPEDKEKLLKVGSLLVKKKTRQLVNQNRRELHVKLHCVSFDVPLEAVRRAFEPIRIVKEITEKSGRLTVLWTSSPRPLSSGLLSKSDSR